MAIIPNRFEEEGETFQRQAIEGSASRLNELKVPELRGFTLADDSGQAYHEEAFKYFLEIERKRSEASNRPFLLMLVDFKRHLGLNSSIDAGTAGNLFSILAKCLRETDFVGWYREGRVAGAVLTQHSELDEADLSEVVRQRVVARLERQLPPGMACDLQVRIYQLSPSTAVRGEQ